MNTPPVALEWLNEKSGRKPWASVREPRQVVEDWQLTTGGRIMKAGLSMSIEQAANLEIEVAEDEVEPECVSAAKNGVITVLVSQSWSPVFAVRVRLYDFKTYLNESSYAAFFNAGQRASKHLLGTLENTKFNIAWPGEHEA